MKGPTMQIFLNFMGADFVAEVDWTLTYEGHPGQTYGPPENCFPPEDPEWDINSITLHECRYEQNAQGRVYREYLGPPFEATGKLFTCLASSRTIDEAILEYLSNNSGDYYDDY